MVKTRRPRSMEELLKASELPYHIGQVIGSMEMAAHQLTMHEDENVKKIGEKLAEVSGWFFETTGDK